MGKQTQAQVARETTSRTWRNQTSWCWNIIPKAQLTGEVHAVVLLDATKVGNLVNLIARTTKHVIGWRWVAWESSNTWELLLQQLPEPTVVVCDGQKGISLAVARVWPSARVQRCMFHVWQNMRAKLTLHPQTAAGIDLLAHFKKIWDIKTPVQARIWQKEFQTIYSKHKDFLAQRTFVKDPAKGQRKWWYTHRGVRSAYRQIGKLIEDEQLFTHLDTELIKRVGQPIPRTTNHLEGGINSQLKEKLKLHRGLTQTHQQRLVDWYLYGRTEDQKPTRFFL